MSVAEEEAFRNRRKAEGGEWKKEEAKNDIEKALKAANKYLNQLTVENFDKLLGKFLELEITSFAVFEPVVYAIFEKCLAEAYLGHVYAELCRELSIQSRTFQDQFVKVEAREGQWGWTAGDDDDFNEGQGPDHKFESEEQAGSAAYRFTAFKRILLNKCQGEFMKEDIYACQKEYPALETYPTDEQALQKVKRINERKHLKLKMLGNMNFIGELYKCDLITEPIVHECIKKLLGEPNQAEYDEQNLESLCKLMEIVGKKLEAPVGTRGLSREEAAARNNRRKENVQKMDMYMRAFQTLGADKEKICARVRFAMQATIEMRRNDWKPRREKLKAKTKDETAADFDKEERAKEQAARSGKAQRSGGGHGRNSSSFGGKGGGI